MTAAGIERTAEIGIRGDEFAHLGLIHEANVRIAVPLA